MRKTLLIAAFFLLACNAPIFAQVFPGYISELTIRQGEKGDVYASWKAAKDPKGNPVKYALGWFTSKEATEPFFMTEVNPATAITIPASQVSSILTEQGIEVGKSTTVYFQVILGIQQDMELTMINTRPHLPNQIWNREM